MSVLGGLVTRGLGRAALVLVLVASLLGVSAGPVAAQVGPPSFTSSALAGHSSTQPTAIEFGPDGKLYVANVSGIIDVYEVQRNGANDYQVVATETITRVADIVNHDDDGSVSTDPATFGVRQVTGLMVAGTAAAPELFVSSSDPRIAPQGGNTPLDTNSGVVSRLTQTTSGTWVGAAKVDLVRGLPRNEENHAINGMALSADGNTLYLATGGNTNMGAPSSSFAFQWEYALSAAILAIDLPAVDALALAPAGCDPTVANDCHLYDLPTLDDPTRPNSGAEDVNDPWGGNSAAGGANQAIIVPGGPVQLHAVGFRNAYDVLLADDGRMYTIDNGPNAGWGGVPNNEGPSGVCDQVPDNGGSTLGDALHYVREVTPGELYYGGHPNPVRGNPDDILADTQGTAVPWSGSPVPIAMTNPVECDYRGPTSSGDPILDNGGLAVWPHSTNGMAEYTASNFGGALQGDILAAGWTSANVVRTKLAYDGSDNPSVVTVDNLLTTSGAPLDLDTRGDAETFPGTIWVANFFGADLIEIYEPDDTIVCGGPPTADDDSDGYLNSDEIDNGTDPCSAASIPPDADGDFVSDLNDPDDDDDGTIDPADPFAVDPTNGSNQGLPIDLQWESPTTGILGLGFTGLMANGTDPWSEQYDETQMTAIGAAGVLTVDAVGPGDALGAANDQQFGFQLGFDPCGPCTPYRASTTLSAPLQGIATPTTESMGVQVGTGDQSNYVKAVVTPGPGGTGGIRLVVEQGDVITSDVFTPAASVMTGSLVTVGIEVDPGSGTASAMYQVDGGPATQAGGPVPVPTAWSSGPATTAVGIVGSSGGAPAFTGTWTSLEVRPTLGTGTGAWSSLAPASEARHETSTVALNGRVYLLGGRGLSAVEVYDPSTDTWSSATPPPVEMHHFQAVTHGGLIYVLGAMTGGFPDEVPLDRIYLYDPNDDRWIEGPELPAGRQRGSAGVAVHGDLIYLVGGIQNGHTSGTVGWTDVYDTVTGTWATLPDMPNPRDHLSAAIVGDNLYVAAGRVTTLADLFSNTIGAVDVLDLTTGTWSNPVDPIPTQRAGASAATLGSEVLIIGGESAQADAHDEVEALHADSGTWRTLAPLPAGGDRHGTGAAIIDCRIYTAAGSGAQGGGPELTSALSFELGPCPIPAPGSGTLNISPTAVDFGTVSVGSSSTIDVTVSNPGGSALTIGSASIVGADAGQFSVGGNYPLTVPGGGSATITVAFTPTVVGPIGAVTTFGDTASVLALVHDGGDSAATVPLAGLGASPGADDPITGLSVSTLGPVMLGLPTTATATVTGGSNVSYDWDMGDGTTMVDAGPSVSHTYAAVGYYTVTITATNAVSSATATTTAAVDYAPPAGQTLINAGGPDHVDGIGRTWVADTHFAGGSTYGSSSPIAGTTEDAIYQSERYGDFSYAVPVVGPGCYSVALHLAELWWGAAGGGGVGSRVFDVSIEGAPVLTGYDIVGAVGATTATVETFLVDLVDSTIDIGFSTQVDNAKISAIEISPAGGSCGPDQPIAGLSVSSGGTVPLGAASSLTASVTGGTNVVYDWEFGDGTTLADGGPSVTHTYAVLGNHTVTVTASNSVSTDTATATAVVGDALISGLTVSSAGAVPVGDPVSLSASVAAGTNVVYDWDFGDGMTLVDGGPSVTHAFATPGDYTVTVTATNPVSSEIGTITQTVTAGPDDPISGLGVVSAGPVALGSASSFAATVTGGTNVTYDWDFGDGTALADGGSSPSHTYGAVGSYTVTVTATNGVSSDAASTATAVEDAAIVGLGVTTDGPVVLGGPMTMTASVSAGSNVVYDWDFGDGTTLTGAGPTVVHTYGAVGSYTVTATATNGVSTDLASTTAIVDPVPSFELLVNAGGGLYTDPVGRTWEADTGSTGGSTYGGGPAIAGTVDDTLYQSERYGDFSYAMAVPSVACYDVTLHFAEIWWGVDGGGGDGSRVFDVALEGIDVLAGFDIHAAVGPATATSRSFRSMVLDGALDVAFASQVDNAKVSAIEVALYGGTCAADDPITGLSASNDSPTVLGASTNLTASVAGGTGVTYDWTMGDGNTLSDAGSSVSYTYAAPGSYVVTVVARNGVSTDSATTGVIVVAPPDDPITGLSVSGGAAVDLGSASSFAATVTGGTNVTYDWDFGDGTVLADGGSSPSHTYGAVGSYTVTVTATNTVSSDSATGSATVSDVAIAGLSAASAGPVVIGDPAALSASITGGTNVVYDWDFGDGTIVADGGPSVGHTYAAVGTYTVTVTAANGVSTASATTAQVVTAEPDAPITGLTVVSGGPVTIGTPASLTASVVGGTNVVYDWDFGDGATLADGGAAVTHTYTAPGAYTVTATAVNGVSSDAASTVAVIDDAPIAGLGASSDSPTVLGAVTSLAASVVGGTNVAYDWDFGDGTTVADGGDSVSHTYAAVGSYLVTVTASNPVSSATATTSVTVQDVAITGLSVGAVGPLYAGTPGGLAATVTDGTDIAYDWDFGDGTTVVDGGDSVSHTYAAAGSYLVTVTASNPVSSVSVSTTLTVLDEPTFVTRINAGGGSYVDGEGNTWSADTGFSGGSTYSTFSAIANTVDDPLFQSERYGDSTYSVAVPGNGCYATTIHLAEIWWGAGGGGGVGSRVFDVTIEGALMVDDLDIYATVGSLTATSLTFQNQVSDMAVDIGFVTVADNAKVSAIEVVSMGATCP